VQRAERCADEPKLQRPRFEVADVLRTFGEAYRGRYVLTPTQGRALDDLLACRTERLGGHLDVCDRCGVAVPSFNSCRNRHCPKCQSLRQARWVLERMQRILPVPYFHVVFTVPHEVELHRLARRNQERFYALLFAAASRTLLALAADEDRLGATPGVTAVLHTWKRDLRYHPHVHCIVTGGGLALDGSRWVRPRYDGRFLFPVRVISRLFRGKLLDFLARAVDAGEIVLGDGDEAIEREAFAQLKDVLHRKEWVVYAKRPFAGPDQVLRYLGRYTHRVGISNHRLLTVDDEVVTFATKNGGTAVVPGVEFIHRFVQHILPSRFVKVRHYGLHAPTNVNTKLEQARALLAAEGHTASPPPVPSSWSDLLEQLTGNDPRRCPACKQGTLVRRFAITSTGDLRPVSVPEPDT
jgi:hypothetical protein